MVNIFGWMVEFFGFFFFNEWIGLNISITKLVVQCVHQIVKILIKMPIETKEKKENVCD